MTTNSKNLPLGKIQALFKIPEKRQEQVYTQVREEARGDLDFFLLNIFSGIIIALGIIINSSAVVIGGMLVAPMFWPILAIALGIIYGRRKIFQKSLLNLIWATLAVLGVAYLIGLTSPLRELGDEFLIRCKPTLFELFIALAAGFVGAFIATYPKISTTIAGVVIAAALIPPLAVLGISLAQGQIVEAGGAFLLYLTNLLAIILAATSVFFLMGFRKPKTEAGKERRKKALIWTGIFLLITCIPLSIITKGIVKQNFQQELISEVFSLELREFQITDIDITEEQFNILTEVTVRGKESISKDATQNIARVLSSRLGKWVTLKINLIKIEEIQETG